MNPGTLLTSFAHQFVSLCKDIPTEEILTHRLWWRGLTAAMLVAGLALAVLSSRWSRPYQRNIAIAWVLLPPIFFFVEWCLLPCALVENGTAFASYQQSQALAAQLWAALAAILGARYLQWSEPPPEPVRVCEHCGGSSKNPVLHDKG